MTPVESDALAGLTAAIEALVPAGAGPGGAQTDVAVSPARVFAAGIGGFAGLHEEPAGEVHARRVEATVVAGISGGSAAQRDEAAGTVTRALLGAERAALRRRGILRVALESGEPAPAAGNRRDLRFSVLYEFLRLPVAPEGVIREVPLDFELGERHGPRPVLLRRAFDTDPLDLFEVFDDPAATTGAPSQWTYAAAEQRIEQRAGIFGGTTSTAPTAPGTYLVLRPPALGPPPVADFTARVTMQADAEGGIGLVFRWQGPDDFYLFLMDSRQGNRMIVRKRGGAFAALDTPALDTTRSYPTGTPVRVRLSARGPRFEVQLDGVPALEGEDAAIPQPGRVGLVARRNDRAFFHDIDLVEA